MIQRRRLAEPHNLSGRKEFNTGPVQDLVYSVNFQLMGLLILSLCGLSVDINPLNSNTWLHNDNI